MKNYKVLNIALILSMILPAGVIPAYAFDFGSGAPALAPAADPQQQPGVDPNTPSNGTQTAPAVQQNTIVPKMTALEQMAQEDTRAVEPVSSGAEAKAADSKETSPATNAATPENTIVSSAPKTTEDNNSNDNRGASEKKSADSRIPVPTEKLIKVEYSDDGNPISETFLIGNDKLVKVYDEEGNLISETFYDSQNRMVSSTTYDSKGNVLSITDYGLIDSGGINWPSRERKYAIKYVDGIPISTLIREVVYHLTKPPEELWTIKSVKEYDSNGLPIYEDYPSDGIRFDYLNGQILAQVSYNESSTLAVDFGMSGLPITVTYNAEGDLEVIRYNEFVLYQYFPLDEENGNPATYYYGVLNFYYTVAPIGGTNLQTSNYYIWGAQIETVETDTTTGIPNLTFVNPF